MIEYGKKKNYIKSGHQSTSILIINAYIGKNKELQNGMSIKEIGQS